jgi:hypothetical protein
MLGSLVSRRIECTFSMHDCEPVTSKRSACYFPLGGLIGDAKGGTARTVKRGERNKRMMRVLRREV